MLETTAVAETPKETPKAKGFLVRFPPELHRLLRLISVERDESLNDLVVQVMQEWVEEQPEAERFRAPETQKKKSSKKKSDE